jgi:endo-1,4-beta-xylanase
VVNEVLGETGDLRDTILLRKLGPGYIGDAFRWAHAADPGAVLAINEYGIETSTAKADALYRLVRDLRRQGVPVHAVGFQSHFTEDTRVQGFEESLRRFSALNVRVAVTELDVRVSLPVTGEKLRKQAEVYAGALRACLAVVACVSFTVWGFSDAFSWIPTLTSAAGAACMFDSEYEPKPAYWSMIGVLAQTPARAAGR